MTEEELNYHFDNIVRLADTLATPGASPIGLLTQVAASYLTTRDFVRTHLTERTGVGKTLN